MNTVDGLHPAVYIQDAERAKEYVVGPICKIENALGIKIIKGLNENEQ